jgi:hypothetical protein
VGICLSLDFTTGVHSTEKDPRSERDGTKRAFRVWRNDFVNVIPMLKLFEKSMFETLLGDY